MPGTDLFFQYADDAEKKVREREAQDRLKAEIINNDRARRMQSGGPTEEPPPAPPMSGDSAGVQGYPVPKMRTQLDETGVVDVMGVADPMGGEQIEDRVDLNALAPSHVLSKDTIATSFLKGVKQTGGQVLQGVGGGIRNAAENVGVDASLGAVYGAIDKAGLENPGLTAYMDTVKKIKSAIGLDAPVDSIANVGTDIGKKGEEIVKANLSAAGTDYFQQQMQSSVASVGLSVSALGLSFLTKNPMLGLSLMGAISGGQQYMDSREFGDTASWSQVTAGLNTTAEILGEKLGFEKLLASGEDVAKKEIKKAIFDGLQAWGLDVGGELLTTLAQDLISKTSDRPNLSTAELQSDLVDTFWSTLFMGPMQTAIVGGMGGAARLTQKSDFGPMNLKEHIEQNFEGSKVDLTRSSMTGDAITGANITLPNGRVVEVHTANSPMASDLKKAVDEGAKKRGIDTEKTAISGAYFKSGLLVGTENDLIYLTGQMTDPTTLPHEKAHLIIELMRDMMTPEELAAIGIPARGVISNDLEEGVVTTFEEYVYKRTPSLTNPMSPLDKAYQNVVDFAHEIYSAFGGTTTQRQVFEEMRTGKILQREGAMQSPGESDAMFQERSTVPAWHGEDVKTKSGVIVGAAGSHQSPQAREGLIRRMVNVATKMHEVNPEQTRWYEMGGEDVRRVYNLTKGEDGKWQGDVDGADRFLRAVAQWSIQADAGRNTGDAVEVMRRILAGDKAEVPGVVSTAQTQAERFVKTMEATEVTKDLAGFGEKAVSFYWDLYNATFGIRDDKNTTIDRHIIGGWDLASRTGRPMQSLKGPQYRWANNIMREITKRFNEQNGTDYTPSQIQPLIWAWQRGGRTFEKGKVDHIGNYIGKGIVTGEMIPATNSDLTPWIHEQGYEMKKAYTQFIVERVLHDADGNDRILQKLQSLFLQSPEDKGRVGLGTWDGAINPNIATKMHLAGMTPEGIRLYADLFGYIFTQNSVGWYQPDVFHTNREGSLQGWRITREDGGQITDSLATDFYEILKTKVLKANITFTGGEIHVVNYMGMKPTELNSRIKEAANEWRQKNGIEKSGQGQFGVLGELRDGDAEGAAKWSGGAYRSRIASAGRSDLLAWADGEREAAVAAAKEFSSEVAPPGAKFQAKNKVDERFKITLTDINGKDITPAVKAVLMRAGEPIRNVMTSDRIWLTFDGKSIGVPYIHQAVVDNAIAMATSEAIGGRIDMEEFGAATQSIRFHGIQRNVWAAGEFNPSLNFEVYAPITDKQMEILKRSVGRYGKILVDITAPDGEVLTYVEGRGPAGLKTLTDTIDKAYAPGAKFQTKTVNTPHGEFPMEHNGWKFEGEWPGTGMYQYSKVLPDSALKATFYVGDPKKVEEIAAKKEAEFAAPKMQTKVSRITQKAERELKAEYERDYARMADDPEAQAELAQEYESRLRYIRSTDPKLQTRTPGPKGLTVNFTSPEVQALGEEMLRGAFDKLQFTQSNDVSMQKAQDLIKSGKVSLETFMSHDPYTAWPDTAHQVAAEAIAGGVFDYVKNRIAEYKAGTITADEANQARRVAMASIASWYLPQSEVGRMLQARQMAISPEGIPIRDLMQEQMTFEKDLQELKNRGLVTDDQVLDAMSKFYSVDQAQSFVRRVAKKKVKDISVLNQLFYFSLLSNPITQTANLIGNLGPVFFAIAEQYLSEKIPYSATPKGGAEGMAAGLYHGLLNAFVLAKRAAQTGESAFGGGKFRSDVSTGIETVDQSRAALDAIMKDKAHPFHDPSSPEYDAAKRDVSRLHRLGSNAISGERFSRLTSGAIDANGSMGRVIDLLGAMTDAPFKGLAAGDEFFKTIAYSMSVYKSAYQLAATNGLEGTDFDNFVATFVDNPTPTADAEAMDFAAKQTFTNEMGEVGQFLQKMSNKEAVGPIVKFFIPFVKITTNIGLYNLERVPILNLTLKQVRDDMAAGGKKRDAAIAKTVSGGAVMLTMAGLAMAGLVTGGGPADPKLKQLWSQPDENGNVAWQEYSFKVGGKWISYKRLEPFATMIGIAADMVEVSRAFNVDIGEMFLVGALAGIRNMTSKTWMLGVSQIIDTLTSGGAEDLGRNAKKLGRQLPSLLIPGGIAQASRVVDPVKRDVQSWMDVIKSRTPGLSSDLEPKYTLKGDPVTVQMYDSMPGKGFGMNNPILYTGNTKDPVSLELVRNRIPISMPSRRLGGGLNPDAANIEGKETGVNLTPEQYGWFVKMAGNGLKDPKTGRGAWDELTAIINGDIPADYNYQKGKKPEPLYYNQKNADGKPVFSDGPEGGKAFIITSVLLAARNEVRNMIEGGEAFPELGAQYEEKKMRKEIRQAPQVGGAR